MKTTYFNVDIPTQPNDHKILGNVLASADALAVSEIAEQYDGLIVVVTPDTKSAVRLSQVLPDLTSQPVQFFLIGKRCLMILFLLIKKLFLRV